MRITKEHLRKVANMQHGENILQQYKLYLFHGKNTTKGQEHLNQFMVLSGLLNSRGEVIRK